MPSLSAVDRAGVRVLGLFEFVGALAAFGARAGVEAFRLALRAPARSRVMSISSATRSAPLILTAGLAIGVVLSMHTRASLERFRRGGADPGRPRDRPDSRDRAR